MKNCGHDNKKQAPGGAKQGTNQKTKRRRKIGTECNPDLCKQQQPGICENQTQNRSKKHPTSGPSSQENRKRRGNNGKRSTKQAAGSHTDCDSNTSIEEELRQQRERQRQKSQAEARNTPTKKEHRQQIVLGKFRFDSTRNAYFPKESFSLQKKSSTTDREISPSNATPEKADPLLRYLWQKPKQYWKSPILSYMAEIYPSAHRRAVAREYWGGRSLLDSMTVYPPARATVDENGAMSWTYLYPTVVTSVGPTDDLVCKARLRPSNRTFDLTVNESTATDVQSLPSIFTMNGGEGIQYRSYHSKKATIVDRVGFAPQSVRFVSLEDGSYGVTGILSHPPWDTNNSFFTISDYSSGQPECLYNNDNMVGVQNDFAMSDTTIMFAPECSGSPVNSMRVHPAGLSDSCTRLHHKTSCFPRSGALCIEACPKVSGWRPTFVMGHRNGQLSFHDIRDGAGSVFATKKPAIGGHQSTDFGSATSIACLSDGNQLVTRGSFGVCHLHDVRKLGHARDFANDCADPSLIWKLSCPQYAVADAGLMSSCCNGIALNPSQTVAVSPVLNASREPSLAMWSLRSGEYIGLKGLTCSERAAPRRHDEYLPYVELCSTATPAYTMTEPQRTTRQQEGGFGLWFKCRSSVPGPGEPEPPLPIWSISHVTFDGIFRYLH